ncbi:hypothetical protein N7509_008842 [Penicillium cosmopolitanum]|uniref:Uncharacterized protein n=1 Tax=Penicillium cosmopolitanum TaxID=1131564 RepID=A0A9X0B339_9EURO|nr:uncharacterized protein N7509_008842 [Penicillium cosmopolitanum]KAJ5386301.1 hypothetical protein N7509_008842 [Penicillium cosmopolitanum]
MPSKVRWTAENDQILLAKMIEAHDFSVDTAKMATLWPGDEESRPTARAIKERIAKIKEISKASSANGPAGPSTPAKRPRNKVAKTPKTPKESTPAGKSRKKKGEASVKVESPIKVESTDEDGEIPEASVKAEEDPVKTEEAEIDESDPEVVEDPGTWSDLDVEI